MFVAEIENIEFGFGFDLDKRLMNMGQPKSNLKGIYNILKTNLNAPKKSSGSLTVNSKGKYSCIGLIELSRNGRFANFNKIDITSYIRKGKGGKAIRVKSHRRKAFEAIGALTSGGFMLGATLLILRKKHKIKNTGSFNPANPTGWLSKQAKANLDEASEVLQRRKGIQIKPEIINDQVFPIAPGAYFHGSPQRLTQFDPNYKGQVLYGSGLYTASDLETAKAYMNSTLKAYMNRSLSLDNTKVATTYQVLEIDPKLKLLDFDDDISDTIIGLFDNPSDRLKGKIRRDFSNLTKLYSFNSWSKRYGVDNLYRLAAKESPKNASIARQYFNGYSSLSEAFIPHIRSNSSYRGIKGYPPNIDKRIGKYKVYWYPEQDLRVERVI